MTNRLKQHVAALRFDALTMRHAAAFRREIIKEKNRYIDAQINSWKVGRGFSDALATEHAQNMEYLFKAHYKKVMKTASDLAPSLIDGLKSGWRETKEDIHETALREWFSREGGKRAKSTALTTSADIRRLLMAAFEDGEPEKEVLRAGLTAKGLSAYRAETISRTETHNAAQYASDYTARSIASENGLDLEKAWMPVMDDRTREDHAAMSPDDWQSMDGMFQVGSDAMQYPGDASASAENIINCRCQLLKRVVSF